MPEYGDKDYWEKRYLKDATEGKMFDWLQSFKSVAPHIEKYLKKSDRIINLGCGNSLIMEEMHVAGYTD